MVIKFSFSYITQVQVFWEQGRCGRVNLIKFVPIHWATVNVIEKDQREATFSLRECNPTTMVI